MHYPVPMGILVLGLLTFSLHAHADAKGDAMNGSKCQNAGGAIRPSFSDSFGKTWEMVKSRDPNQIKADAAKCCSNAAADNGKDCGDYLKGIAGGSWNDPFQAGSDEANPPKNCNAGMNNARECQKYNLLVLSRQGDRKAAVCRAIARTCASRFPLGPVPSPPECEAAILQSDHLCREANENIVNWAKVDPGQTQQQPGGGNTPGGSNNGNAGNNPGQAPTQKGGNNQQMMQQLAQAAMMAGQAAMQNQKKDEATDENENFTSETCDQNSNLAGCPAKLAESDSWNKNDPKGEIKTASTDSTSSSNMNVPAMTAQQPGYDGNNKEQKFGTPPTNPTVANGGGQMLGQNGGGGGQAGGQTTGGFGIASKAATDIMHGMMGGGGYAQMNAAMQLQNGGNGGFSGYGQQMGEWKPNMDLKQFLPGGKADPTRKLAGGASSFQIQPQTVNIWSRISERFRARCTQGLLRDCNP